jgi:tripartite-type tricarboxylate transporter receptor subunit TctC
MEETRMRSVTAAARILLAVVMSLAIPVTAAVQERYPGKPVHLISPYSPGGGNDTMARLIGQALTESWGQQVVVENRPGANTLIGTDHVAKAAPDGYTLLFAGVNTFILNALLVRTPYDIVKDFAPVAMLAKTETIMVVHPSVPAKSLRELIALAKAKPGQLNYATSAAGGSGHLVGELFKTMAGVNIQHIPYKGSSRALVELAGGQVDIAVMSPVATIPLIRAGRLRGIAISGDARFPPLPQVPTFAESGLQGLEAKVTYGILATGGAPKQTVAKVASDVARIQRLPDFQKKLARQGVDPFILGPEEFAASIRTNMANYASIIKTANIKLK